VVERGGAVRAALRRASRGPPASGDLRYARLVIPAALRTAALCTALVGLTSCATKSTMTVPAGPAGRVLVVDEKAVDVPADGRVAVEVGPGFQPVAWELRTSGAADATTVATGAIARTEPLLAIAATAAAGAACCVPTLAVAGMCLANPGLLAAPLLCLASPDVAVGICVPVLQAPSCATVPLATTGAALGLSPLLLGLVAQAPPDAVDLEVPPPASPQLAQGGVPW
jgi:hypothetical protein